MYYPWNEGHWGTSIKYRRVEPEPLHDLPPDGGLAGVHVPDEHNVDVLLRAR